MFKRRNTFCASETTPQIHAGKRLQVHARKHPPPVYISEKGAVLTTEEVNRLERRVVADNGKGTRGVVRAVVIATAVALAGLFWVLSRGKSRQVPGQAGRGNGGGV